MIFLFLLNIWLFKKSVYKEVVNSHFCTAISLMTKKKRQKKSKYVYHEFQWAQSTSNVTPACSFMTLFNQMHTNRSFDVYAITVYETLTFSSLLIDYCKH